MPRKDLTSYPKRIGYRKHPGMIAWLLHRITGVIIILYLILHILGSSGVCSFLPFIVQNKTVELILLISFIFHAFNGVRIMLVEFSKSVERKSFKRDIYIIFFLVLFTSITGLCIMFF